MLEQLKNEAELTRTENGALTYTTTGSHCLDLFACIGALRHAGDKEIIRRFLLAYAEDRDLAMKILFYARDVRGGLGERKIFRTVLRSLAWTDPDAVRKNLPLIPEYGRWDDILLLMDTVCGEDVTALVSEQLERDMASSGEVSLLAKWLPSVNASNKETIRMGRRLAQSLGMPERRYRKTLTALRRRIRILENNLRERDYTFDYAKQPSRAMFKYRKAFLRNDGERYRAFLDQVTKGDASMHTDTLMPCDVIAPCFNGFQSVKLSKEERNAMDVAWNALPDFASDENAIVVVDGSGSMYCTGAKPLPITVALSLGIYFAERNRGAFADHFITFSETPRLVEIKGKDIAEKVAYCASFSEVANTDLAAVFRLILDTAVKHGVPKEEMPARLYVVSDMEFDECVEGGEVTNFAYARRLFREHEYELPEVVFWNVASRNRQQPVRRNESGAALVSGCSPRLFGMVSEGLGTPYEMMMEIIGSERYAAISA